MLKLMPRDWLLMEGLYANTMMSFKQIANYYFEGRAKSTIHNRLTQLEQGGIIRRFKMGRILHHLLEAEIGVVFSLSKIGLTLLQARTPWRTLRIEPVPVNTSTLYHDLLLVDVTKKLESIFPEMNFVSGKLLGLPSQKMKRIPDIIGHWQGTNKMMAIELELTTKSEKRYRQILTEYRIDQNFEKILYITSHVSIEEKIKTLLTHKKVDSFMRPSTGKFYFATLSDLLKDSPNLTLSNGTDNLCPVKENFYAQQV
jgi:DNA-binding Lrp family transcriptional regulator